MRILILGSKEYPVGTSDDEIVSGGMEIYTQGLVKHLKNKVEEIILITRKFKNTKSFERTENITICRVPWIKGFYFRNASFNFFSFFKAFSLNFDVILAQGAISTFFGILISKIKKKPIISRPAGVAYVQPQYNSFVKNALLFLERKAYSNCDFVVFLSDGEKEQFEKKLRFLPKKSAIAPTGIDTGKFENLDREKLKEGLGLENKTVITFVGRLIEVKGVEYLIEACAELKEDFYLLIVGDGPLREKLAKTAERLGKKAVFLGWRRDVPGILAASDIFVLPSISEGLPVALLEAMAGGKACVATDIGLPIKHEKTGLIVPPKDSRALAAAIERLISDRELRERLGKNARKVIKEEYSWEKAVEKYMEIFNSFRAARR